MPSRGTEPLPSKRPLARLRDIRDNGRRIETYIGTMNAQSFFDDTLVYDATERCLSRISEAAVKLGDQAAALVPTQDWRGIRHLGNALRHDYDGVNATIIWRIVSISLPSLVADVEAVLARYPAEQDEI